MPSTLETRISEWFVESTISGKSRDLTSSFFGDAQENIGLERINVIVEMIKAQMSGFSFAFDKQLSTYISGYKSLAYVSTHVISQNLLGKIIGGCYSRLDMMASQSFMISAFQKRHYTLRDNTGKGISTSFKAIPCLLNHDHRILIPFFVKDLGHEIYLVCNEFWGQPCGVIDFVDRLYYSDGGSPKMRSNDPSLSIHSLVLNLLAWNLAQLSESSSSNTSKLNILLGGTVNLSHILWNYLGGIEVLRRTGCLDGEYNLVQISNLLFPVNHLPVRPLDLSSSDPLSQVLALAKLGLSSSLWIRCSDAGNSPLLAKKILSADSSGYTAKSIQLIEQQSTSRVSENLYHLFPLSNNFQSLPDGLKNNEVSIAITLRCTSRSLGSQGMVFAEAIALLADKIPSLHVILDGSSKGASPIVIAKEKEIADIIQSSKAILALINSGSLRISSTVEMKLSDQLQLYRHINTFLTYASGGMVKFTAFCSFLGTVIGPEANELLCQSHFLQDLDNAYIINQKLALLLFPSSCRFLMWHDHIGYANLNQPVSMLLGKLIDGSNDSQNDPKLILREKAFDSSFHLSAEDICLNILRCLVYNKISTGRP